MRYYVWTVGCQMNEADSERIVRALQDRGLAEAQSAEQADVVILNTCSVRQAAEDKALSKVGSLRPLKLARPDLIIGFGGCMVAGDTVDGLRRRLPYVDVFFPPSEPDGLLELIDHRMADRDPTFDDDVASDGCLAPTVVASAGAIVNTSRPRPVARWLPIMSGCNRRCTYCIVPFRRGREVSRPIPELVDESRRLVADGAREITLLGQIVDRYGRDLRPQRFHLGDLLRALQDVEGLERIRFLTSHPRDFTEEVLEATATLPKVCEHINIPVQAGDDDVLQAMWRGYTIDVYRRIVARIRERIPTCSIATDIIVGFPGETEDQFRHTLDLMEELRFDVVHVAMYSPRPGTVAGDRMPDLLSQAEKKDRLHRVEEIQERVSLELNQTLVGTTQQILVEDTDKGKWKGRTRTNKLVFFEDPRDWLGRLAEVRIDRASPWSLQGSVVGGEQPGAAHPVLQILPVLASRGPIVPSHSVQ
ncbi:MAG TPA: tRNA (N6-isopentenyl adenosine(37)-C2)-methylthiotransferase MiaB [Chloroflexota bacterium]|nr:tRNA (N6-isopentenyl adenosine(37)-C2)-methylthiotransferase MiaB [Chloroflexota bacterium]